MRVAALLLFVAGSLKYYALGAGLVPPVAGNCSWLLRAAAWPGDGVQLTFMDQPGEIVLIDGRNAAVASAPVASGLTGVLLLNLSPAHLEVARQLLRSLPAEERVAVFILHAGEVATLVDVSVGVQHAMQRLQNISPSFEDSGVLDVAGAMRTVATSLSLLDSALLVSRFLLVLGRGASPRPAPAVSSLYNAQQPVLVSTLWLRFDSTTDAAVLVQSTTASMAVQRRSIQRAAACLGSSSRLLRIQTAETDGLPCRVMRPPSDSIQVPCIPEDAADGAYPYPERIILKAEDAGDILSAFQSASSPADKEFQLNAEFSGMSAPMVGVGHFSALSGSFAVKLVDNTWLAPEFRSNHFVLRSLAPDLLLRAQITSALALHAGFPGGSLPRTVMVYVASLNGSTAALGACALSASSFHLVSRQRLALAARVRLNAEGGATVKLSGNWSAFREADALRRFNSILEVSATCGVDGTACYDALAAVIDVDAYIRATAFTIFCGLGSFTNVEFFASSELSGPFWTPMAFHQDVSWSVDPMIRGGGCRNTSAHFDGTGLLSCPGILLEGVLARVPDMRRRFFDHLESMFTSLPSNLVADVAQRQLAALVGLISSDEAGADANIYGSATSAAQGRSALAFEAERFVMQDLERRAVIMSRLRLNRQRMGASLRSLNNATAAGLRTVCDSLADTSLNVSLTATCVGYTSSCQELLLSPRIYAASSTFLQGLRLTIPFDRSVIDALQPDKPMVTPPASFTLACLSGGGVADRADQVPPNDLCSQYGIQMNVQRNNILLAFTSDTASLCAGCSIDLGVDGAMVALSHVRWRQLAVNASGLSVQGSCSPELAAAPAPARMVTQPAGVPPPSPAPPSPTGLLSRVFSLFAGTPPSACSALERLFGCRPTG